MLKKFFDRNYYEKNSPNAIKWPEIIKKVIFFDN